MCVNRELWLTTEVFRHFDFIAVLFTPIVLIAVCNSWLRGTLKMIKGKGCAIDDFTISMQKLPLRYSRHCSVLSALPSSLQPVGGGQIHETENRALPKAFWEAEVVIKVCRILLQSPSFSGPNTTVLPWASFPLASLWGTGGGSGHLGPIPYQWEHCHQVK